jgi:hypothetical protein
MQRSNNAGQPEHSSLVDQKHDLIPIPVLGLTEQQLHALPVVPKRSSAIRPSLHVHSARQMELHAGMLSGRRRDYQGVM